MEMSSDLHLRVGDASVIGEARRRASEFGRRLGLNESDVGRIAIVATEAATNLVKHTEGGELLVQALAEGELQGVGVLALDRGPGFIDFDVSMRDGTSTIGTAGRGLGAIARLSTCFDIYTAHGGSALFASIWPEATPPVRRGMLVGGINVPHPREDVSGDAWALRLHGSRTMILVADGLGHGILAAEAAGEAVGIFGAHSKAAAAEILQRVHQSLRATRGAAVAVIEIDRSRGTMLFAGLGNIAGTVITNGTRRSVVSHHGIAGHAARRIEGFSYPWTSDSVLVLHSDGLSTHWDLAGYPGLLQQHPQLAAAVLYRDFARGRDDTTVVVVKEAA
jgi:anti-sigma regulatory factor (Ser/Thr protein kinase)